MSWTWLGYWTELTEHSYSKVCRVFLECPRNGRPIRSGRMAQAKRRILVLTVNVKVNHWRKIKKRSRSQEWGWSWPSVTLRELNPDFSKIISTEADLPKPHDEGWLPHGSLDLSPESSAPSIHNYLGVWLFSPFSLHSEKIFFAPKRWPGMA